MALSFAVARVKREMHICLFRGENAPDGPEAKKARQGDPERLQITGGLEFPTCRGDQDLRGEGCVQKMPLKAERSRGWALSNVGPALRRGKSLHFSAPQFPHLENGVMTATPLGLKGWYG